MSPFQIDDWFCFITLEDLDTMITIFQLSYKRVIKRNYLRKLKVV